MQMQIKAQLVHEGTPVQVELEESRVRVNGELVTDMQKRVRLLGLIYALARESLFDTNIAR